MAEKKKILLVDDSDLVAGMLSEFLGSKGYDVIRAANGVEGIERAYKDIPDAIIMDVEMPLLQGYQASRLLKSRRGVKDIPIIMHTSLSEDKDKYWAISSGADEYTTKDFDNLDALLSLVRKYTKKRYHDPVVINEDAADINQNRIMELIGSLYDQQLFASTITNMLGDVGRSIGSLDDTIKKILGLINNVCDAHIAVIMLKVQKKAHIYIMPSDKVYKSDMDDFIGVSLNDFHSLFPDINLKKPVQHLYYVEHRKDFEKMRLDQKKISSYIQFDIIGKGGKPIGSLHVGNLSNNYFSNIISQNIFMFTERAAPVLENSLLFNDITEMKDKIKSVFAKFVPSEIIDDLIEKESEKKMLVGEKRQVVILFSDIRSFTTISENNSAENVVGFLNNYFNIMGDIIKKYGGTIDKFIGDAILAVFGVPTSYEDNAVRAIMAAAQMVQTLKKIRIKKLNLPGDSFDIGIGLHEGDVIVGNIGSQDKFDYTVIGDSVNLAARLEGLTKHYKQHILVSEAIKNKVDNIVYLREVDSVKVKGKSEATVLYTLEPNSENTNQEFITLYSKGIKLYKMGNWNTAVEYFSQACEIIEGDYLAGMFLERCKTFQDEPPKDWDGAIALDFK